MLLLVFLFLAFVLILFLWGGSMVLQGWLYQDPAERMPQRAAVCGASLALFLTLWCFIDSRTGGKYDTIFEFTPYDVSDHDSFDAIMTDANGNESKSTYRKRSGTGGATTDFVDTNNQPWKKVTSDKMCVAVEIRDKDKPEAVRFNATLDPKGNLVGDSTQLRYVDAGGRYTTASTLGRVYRRKLGLLIGNIILNLVHLLLWWAALWYGMRFLFWYAFGLAVALWVFIMLAVMPVLFSFMRG